MAEKRKKGGGPFGTGKLKKGQLHRDLHIPQDQKIPASTLAAAAKRPGKVGQRARAAQTMKKKSFREG